MFLAIFFFPVYPILSGRGGKSAIEIEARSNLERGGNYGARIIIGSSGGSIKIIDSCFLFVREHGRDMGEGGLMHSDRTSRGRSSLGAKARVQQWNYSQP